jgi:hypothetical protein
MYVIYKFIISLFSINFYFLILFYYILTFVENYIIFLLFFFLGTCFDGYTSGDCSLRTCPYGRAWWDEPSTTNVAHAPAECSNRGNCDRSNGKCACAAGFSGAACQIINCPSAGDDGLPCSGRGRCVSMREMSRRRMVNGILAPIVYGTVRGAMETWDADKIYGCTCDGQPWLEGGSDANGTNCFERDCPRGDDLNTDNQSKVMFLIWNF